MRAEELRIGNLVTIDNETSWSSLKDVAMTVHRVEIGKDKMFPLSTGSVRCSDGKKEYNQFDEFIKPIPLTEEWLKRFGFERLDSENEFDKDMFSRSAISSTGRKLPFIIERCLNGSYSPPMYMDIHEEIHHIHQLQNLYFALTGEELKLN